MAINNLTAKDICTIIKTCKRAGISEFELGTLKFKIGAHAETVGTQLEIPGVGSYLPQSGMVDQPQNAQKTELSDEDKENIRLETESTLALNDPEFFEDHVTDQLLFGEVTHGRHDGENDSRRIEHSVY